MAKRLPTPQQKKVLDEIKRYWSTQGISPAISDLAEFLGVSSPAIHHHVVNLKKQGLLSFTAGVDRSFVPTPDKIAPNLTQVAVSRSSFFVRLVPVLGQVAAGVPILAQENVEGGLWVEWSGPQDVLFALRVRGDSMIKAGIFNNDLVVVRQQLTFHDGDIVVALIDREEATIKRLKRQDGLIGLFPENDAMTPLWFASERVVFQGVVVESRRHYKVYLD